MAVQVSCRGSRLISRLVLDLALMENMLKAVSRTHDPISDGLYRLMARSDEHLQRFINRTESSGQWAALTEADHELLLADMLADSARRRPCCLVCPKGGTTSSLGYREGCVGTGQRSWPV